MTTATGTAGGRYHLLVAAGVSALFTAVLLYMVEHRAAILRSGAEIVLKTVPVDPRDLLRGDYVVLSYEVSRIPVSLVKGDWPAPGSWTRMNVRLRPGPDGYWTVAEAAFGDLPPAEGSVVLRTQRFRLYTTPADDGGEISVDYGIERYYVPEGEGRPIEDARNDDEVSVAARVGAGGQAQIRELRVRGVPAYEEPLY
ncbi:putative membrane-anchored protein [Ciceribacter lividus]|uniref:Putative membrane-anchored protein n=1 Tax=Ciceribacter lividus TaxID=1197950 RepID=A0A6I7HNE9_9HYPH|nr:GDYXXLXY domain-containing protein [Ciceribacter lividus]RCW24750.1 putative membrane-anchored protein [Ciceribacter lividus]